MIQFVQVTQGIPNMLRWTSSIRLTHTTNRIESKLMYHPGCPVPSPVYS